MTYKEYENEYALSHQNRWNIVCHYIGIPLILVSLVALFFDVKGALLLFVIGWIFQFVGHKFEGKKPSFVTDVHFLAVGPIFFFRKILGKVELKSLDKT